MVLGAAHTALKNLFQKKNPLVKNSSSEDFIILFYSLTTKATASQCTVCGNISTGCTSFTTYPFSTKNFKSLAKVAGLQDT
jgi:heterodisulfide reductase subunit C